MQYEVGMDFLTYGCGEHYEPERFKPVSNGSMSNKPMGGLWASPVDAEYGWRYWCRAEDFHQENLKEAFRFSLRPEARVLVIDSKEDLNNLPGRFFLKDVGLSSSIYSDRASIDFERISQEYDAIFLTEKGEEETRDWYDEEGFPQRDLCTWDCETLLVLNPGMVIEKPLYKEIKNDEPLKVIICGPPHSGKSVFIGGLRKHLPGSYLFRANPDGEGTWTYRNDDSASFRRKGKFTKEQTDWYVEKLHSLKRDFSELVIVDVGGRFTQENMRIFKECNAAIILSGDPDFIVDWRDLCVDSGVRILAEIHSDYNAKEDIVGEMLSVHHLERGEDVTDRPAVIAAAERILSEKRKILGEPVALKSRKGIGNIKMLSKIEISDLAKMLGKESVEKTLPNGRVINTIEWKVDDLKDISKLLHNQEKAEIVQINGAAPAWLVAALAHECHPSLAEINSPDGYVLAQCNKPSEKPEGANLEWSVNKVRQGLSIVTVQQKDPSVPLTPKDLINWTPPKVDFSDIVVLSGRMPNWGMAALAMAYHGNCKAVSLFQPGIGATVALTHSADVELGRVIDAKLLMDPEKNELVKKDQKSEKSLKSDEGMRGPRL